MKQVEILIKILRDRGGKVSYSDKGQQAGIRKTIESNSSDSEAYTGKNDYFYSVKGKGRGVWGLR